MNRNLIIGLLVFFLCICILCIGAGAAFFLLVARAPYSISADKMTVSYLEKQDKIAGLEMEEEPTQIKSADDAIAYYVEPNDSKQVASISVGKDKALFDQAVKYVQELECTVRTNSNGEWMGAKYYKGTCDEYSYYVYTDGTAWIVFDSEKEGNHIDQFINDYIN